MLLKDDKENSTKALWPVIEKQNAAEKSLVFFQESRIIFPSSFSIALSPIIIQVEHGNIWKVTILLEGPIFHFRDYGRKDKNNKI